MPVIRTSLPRRAKTAAEHQLAEAYEDAGPLDDNTSETQYCLNLDNSPSAWYLPDTIPETIPETDEEELGDKEVLPASNKPISDYGDTRNDQPRKDNEVEVGDTQEVGKDKVGKEVGEDKAGRGEEEVGSEIAKQTIKANTKPRPTYNNITMTGPSADVYAPDRQHNSQEFESTSENSNDHSDADAAATIELYTMWISSLRSFLVEEIDGISAAADKALASRNVDDISGFWHRYHTLRNVVSFMEGKFNSFEESGDVPLQGPEIISKFMFGDLLVRIQSVFDVYL